MNLPVSHCARFGVGRSSDDPAPELRMALIAIPARNGGQIGDGLMDALAVDGSVRGSIRRELPAKKRVFEFIQSRCGNLSGRPGGRGLGPGQRSKDR